MTESRPVDNPSGELARFAPTMQPADSPPPSVVTSSPVEPVTEPRKPAPPPMQPPSGGRLGAWIGAAKTWRPNGGLPPWLVAVALLVAFLVGWGIASTPFLGPVTSPEIC